MSVEVMKLQNALHGVKLTEMAKGQKLKKTQSNLIKKKKLN